MGCKKDAFYGFLRDARINWRKLMYHINAQFWTWIEVCSKHGAWGVLITTNTRVDFFEAYRIYAQRWSREVVFKERKGMLDLLIFVELLN